MTTTFTIVIPTHDRRETVVLAARSVLAQTRSPLELLVLCDGCTDGTERALEELGDERLVPLSLPKLPGYAYGHRNVSLERARGTAIMWMGDDDLLLPDHLERLGAAWDSGRFDIVTSPAAVVHPDDSFDWCGENWGLERNRIALQRDNSNVMASVSVSVALARKAGGWDPAVPRAGDWDLWKRVLAAGGRATALSEPTVLHFRATGRVQSWPDRVQQNTAWSVRLTDPDGLAQVRWALGMLRDGREARLRNMLTERESELAWLRATRWWRLRGWLGRVGRRLTRR